MNKDHRYQISTDCQVWRVEITRFNSLVQEAGRYAIPRKLSFSVIINEGRRGGVVVRTVRSCGFRLCDPNDLGLWFVFVS